MIWVVIIISLVAAVAIVNGGQNLYMKMIGADAMFFKAKSKLIAIGVITLVLAALLLRACDIDIPG